MRPSSRLPRESAPNALSLRLAALRRTGTSYVDLTESNPTRAGIAYPDGLLLPLGGATRQLHTHVQRDDEVVDLLGHDPRTRAISVLKMRRAIAIAHA